ncbi:putative pyrophosphatase [Neobacillus bataviensis LMG 21833]|uniref:Putative pyrophosphatase n=1 Tax=Neobacillus bataviensis LMG 21833 TaxID=1117379 RepID=K6DLS1_9BACI|nr:nucleotide pyrophosphohydrolase [Neobacillus bataviensis]EKN69264.1 putative pyrophosphatase [Neobacillus bataviensis LMG 21833]
MKEIQQRVLAFRDERDWKQYHNEKDLAISISLEANELLENFQWRTSEEAIVESKQNIKEEMADILIYLVQLADKLEINLEEEVFDKLVKNAIKYPVNRSGEKVK